MTKKNTGKRLSEYNSIIKETDELYRDAARALGLPDCAFWILYVLREDGRILTQSEICDAIYQPKQTVNSALKKLEREGFIKLADGSDRRSKSILFTKKGEALAGGTVDRVIAAEHKALAGLTGEEQEVFIGLFRKYTDLLKENMSAFDCRHGRNRQ